MIIDTSQHLTPQEFAEAVGCTETNIYYYIKRGRMPFIEHRGCFYIHKSEVKKWDKREKLTPGPKRKSNGVNSQVS